MCQTNFGGLIVPLKKLAILVEGPAASLSVEDLEVLAEKGRRLMRERLRRKKMKRASKKQWRMKKRSEELELREVIPWVGEHDLKGWNNLMWIVLPCQNLLQ